MDQDTIRIIFGVLAVLLLVLVVIRRNKRKKAE
jgi:hypothetical protein